MAHAEDPTVAIRKKAAALPSVSEGASCNQSSFKVGKGTFLFIGPGPRGKGFKAMFKLDGSMPQAEKLAAEEPERFEVGKTGWVTTRFTMDKPLPRSIWERWLQESYDLTCSPGTRGKRKTAGKKGTRKV